MCIRLLFVEPDEDVGLGYMCYFSRTTEFELQLCGDSNECFTLLKSFSPQVMVLEPELPCRSATQILDRVDVPVVVLTRMLDLSKWQDHPAIDECHQKPKRLAELVESVRRLASV